MIWILSRKPHPVLWKGVVAGAAGGLGATVAMTAFQSLWNYVDDRIRAARSNGGNGASRGLDFEREPIGSSHPDQEGDDAAANAAERLSQGFFGYELEDREKKLAGTAVHFGFGTAVGAVYGSVAEFTPNVTRGDGIPFGTGLMVVADEVAVPALGLGRPPQQLPLSTHMYALCSHAVYGFVLESIRRSVRRAL